MINGGFTLNGTAAKDLGITMISTSRRPILPPTVDRTLAIPGRNGAWDFGADVGPRPIYLDCAVISWNAKGLQEAAEKLAAILVDGYGKPQPLKLVFDLRPDRYYTVRYSGSLDIERIIGLGRFTIPFVAFDPYPRSIVSSDNIILDTDILLDSDIRLGADYSFQVISSGEFVVNNFGTMIVEPIIEVAGSFSSLTISANGKSFTFDGSISQPLIIDCERMIVRVGSTNKLSMMSGDFPVLLPGDNKITVSGTELYALVSFNFQAKYT